MENSVHFNQEIDIFVNEKDIANGKPNDESCCAISLAVERTVKADLIDERFQDEVDVQCIVNQSLIDVHYNDEFAFSLDADDWDEVNDFIESFDLRDEDGEYIKDVTPTVFKMTVSPE